MTVHSWGNRNIKQDRGQGGRLEEMTHDFLSVCFLKKLWILPPLSFLFVFSIQHFYSVEQELIYKWNNIKINTKKESLATTLKTKHSSSSRCSLRKPRRAELVIIRIAHLSTTSQHPARPGVVPTLEAVARTPPVSTSWDLSPANSEVIPGAKSPQN